MRDHLPIAPRLYIEVLESSREIVPGGRQHCNDQRDVLRYRIPSAMMTPNGIPAKRNRAPLDQTSSVGVLGAHQAIVVCSSGLYPDALHFPTGISHDPPLVDAVLSNLLSSPAGR